MKSINQSALTPKVLTLGALALGGMIALAAPASAYDDDHGNNTVVQRATVPSGKRVWAESAAQYSACLAAEEEAQRMRD